MVMIGADVDELRLSGKVLEQSASDIVDHIAPALDKALTRTAWSGPDANSFKSLWFSSLSPSLKTVAGELDKAAKTLRNNADAQEDTSAQGGGFATSGGVAGGGSSSVGQGERVPTPNGGKGNGVYSRTNPEGYTEPRVGGPGFLRDVADLAAACYDHTTGINHDALIPPGWEEVSADELRKLGIERDLFGVEGDQFSCTLYRDVNGRYVMAFEGTNPGDLRDWANNAHGQASATFQDIRAARIGALVRSRLAANGIDVNKLTFTGHSLGGRLAQVASVATGAQAIGFNPAGISKDAIKYASEVRKGRFGESYSPIESEQKITHVVTEDDPLHAAQQLGVDKRPIGTSYYVKTPDEQLTLADKYWVGNYFKAEGKHHGMDAIRGGIDEAHAKAGINTRAY